MQVFVWFPVALMWWVVAPVVDRVRRRRAMRAWRRERDMEALR